MCLLKIGLGLRWLVVLVTQLLCLLSVKMSRLENKCALFIADGVCVPNRKWQVTALAFWTHYPDYLIGYDEQQKDGAREI